MTDQRIVNADQFIEEIATSSRAGFGFNPLFGSGMSAPSGIIMGTEFANYLAYCVDKGLSNSWDFRKNGWPPYDYEEHYQESLKRVRERFNHVCRKYHFIAQPETGPVVSVAAEGAWNSLPHLLNVPPVPAALRSPSGQSPDHDTQRLVRTLRGCGKEAPPYEPLWPDLAESPASWSRLEETGIRALADWRTTLHFLSRLVQAPNDTMPRLEDPDPSVTDSFNAFIVGDKQPNLAHKMLVHLLRPLRIRTILTTNFDTLIEDAFAQADMRLLKFVVSSRGELPDPQQVRAHSSIIKLHGERLETRADLTLDDDPAPRDHERFVRYFFEGCAERRLLYTMPSHLLVAGFSANDLRIVRLIQNLLLRTRDFPDHLRPKVFWVGFKPWDLERVAKFLPPDEYLGRVFLHETVRPDLLLLEMYQRIALSLPGGGLTYEYSHNVPPKHYGSKTFAAGPAPEFGEAARCIQACIDRRVDAGVVAEQARDVLSRLVGHVIATAPDNAMPQGAAVAGLEVADLFLVEKGSDYEGGKHFKTDKGGADVVLVAMPFGALEALSIPYERFLSKSGQECLWFELAGYLNADSLLRDILRTIALRIGRYQSEQVMLHPLRDPLTEEAQAKPLTEFLTNLCRVWRLSPSRWKIFIYGRDLAGSCVGWTGALWRKADWISLEILVKAFAAAGFNVVYAIPTRARWRRERDRRDNQYRDLQEVADPLYRAFRGWRHSQYESERALLEDALPSYGGHRGGAPQAMSIFDKLAKSLRERFRADPTFKSFFHAVALFRQERAPSALFYEAVQNCPRRFNMVGIDNDLLRANTAAEWVQELRAERIFYHKPGGFSWIHRDLRLWARAELEHPGDDKLPNPLAHSLSHTHFWIGDWYFKAFCSTGFTLPIIECLHHRFQAALTARFARPKARNNEAPVMAGGPLARHQFAQLRSALLEMTKTLILARQHLKLWLANRHGFPMFRVSSTGECIIHNQFEAQGQTEETIRAALTGVVGAILNPDGRKVVSLPEWEEEIEKQIDLFEYQVRVTNQAIRQEASLSPAQLDLAPFLKNGSPVALSRHPAAVNLGALTNMIYHDRWIDDGLETPDSDVPQKQKLRESAARGKAPGTPSAAGDGLFEVLRQLLGADKPAREFRRLLRFEFGDGSAFDERAYAESKLLAPRFERLPALLSCFEQLAYARMRRAKFESHSTEPNGTPSELIYRLVDVRKSWLRVTQLCNLAIDWCKHLPAEFLQLEMQLKVRLHCYYSVALANLDRFREAHRHIDEASGLNSKREITFPRIELAKLRLRRAEVYLTEAHRIRSVIRTLGAWLKDQKKNRALHDAGRQPQAAPKVRMWKYLEKFWCLEETDRAGVNAGERNASDRQLTDAGPAIRPWIHPAVRGLLSRGEVDIATVERVLLDLVRLMTATIDDAWVRLEYAEKGLSGASQSNLWWGRLAGMKLRAFAYQFARLEGLSGPDPDPHMRILAYQYRRINPQALWEIFETSYLNNDQSPYRRLRLIRYTAEALRVCAQLRDDTRGIKGHFEDLRKDMDAVKREIEEQAEHERLLRMWRTSQQSLVDLRSDLPT